MSTFRTIVDISPSLERASRNDTILVTGSCFSEHMGHKLRAYKYRVDLNPHGIMYNPLSIEKGIRRLISGRQYTGDELLYRDGRWISFDHHGDFSSPDKQEALSLINGRFHEASRNLVEAKWIIITWGTAWIYALPSTGEVVANCHKIPDKEFTRYLVSHSEIVDRYRSLVSAIRELNPGARIILTISPVRHLRDGFTGNQVSKSTLMLAAREISTIEGVFYFPSYEIMIDDLRDYRFYADDMVHPAPVAIDYIWEKFASAYLEENDKASLPEIDKIRQGIMHRPFQPLSPAYLSFLENLLAKCHEIEKKYKGLQMVDERNWIGSKIREIQGAKRAKEEDEAD